MRQQRRVVWPDAPPGLRRRPEAGSMLTCGRMVSRACERPSRSCSSIAAGVRSGESK
jgi:hypothetical protein